MLLYNSLTRRKEEFRTAEPGVVKMYTCGPTVYHYAHIGNLRTYIMEDVLEKYLTFSGYEVRRVMNITDVGHLTSDGDTGDDKMVQGARREHKSVMEIAKFYGDAFFEDCARLHIAKPRAVCPATERVGDFIEVIETLLRKGYAYEAGGNIYFDTSKLPQYYVFHDFREEDLEVGVREGVERDENKRNKADFVLWFTKSKFDAQELKWESPWGTGYPGWHIECSVIAMKTLGERLDLHCGGIDNVFPHHTNEIAQSEAYLGHPWCTHWFHVLHLNTADGKMSKSKGEFLTLSLLEEKGYDPMVYRFYCLQSHYRKTLEFSFDNLDNAKTAYTRLVARLAALLKEREGEPDTARGEELLAKFRAAMDNDLNTAQALTELYEVLKAPDSAATKLWCAERMDSVLSLGLLEHAGALKEQQEPAEIPPEVEKLVSARAEARKNRDFQTADALRDQIAALGWAVKETRQGTVLEPLTKQGKEA